jgi:hypothetical protein
MSIFVGPRPSFEETLVRFDHFLDFDTLVKKGDPGRAEIVDLTDFAGYVDPIKGI